MAKTHRKLKTKRKFNPKTRAKGSLRKARRRVGKVELSKDVYERLADALDKLPNGFPRTKSKIEIAILRKIFSSEEASLASQLSRQMDSVEAIANRAGVSVEEAEARLTDMAKRRLLWSDKHDGKQRFRLAPFVVGIYEAQRERMDHEFAHLIEEYMTSGGAVGIMKPQPALHRVIPAQQAVKSEWILPYDDVKKVLLSSKSFRLNDCICRMQQDHLGRRCSFPLRTCLSFSTAERPPTLLDITKDEALAYLDKAEEMGLVHTVSNVMKGLGYVCNCCGCCCGILRGITDWGIENSVAQANYFAAIDPEKCLGCEKCVKRCQVHAVSKKNRVAEVDRKHCIGCGLCVTGCPSGAATLQRKPSAETIHPPPDFEAWEDQRLRDRGLIK